LFLTFYPIVFQRIHGFNEGVGGVSSSAGDEQPDPQHMLTFNLSYRSSA
jgi:hypothetical protein